MSESSSRHPLLRPLEHREFATLWMGFIVSHVGDSMQLHAQNWLVSGMTRSGARLGAVALAQAIPRLFLGIFAGVVVDRVDRRRLLIATQLLAMLQATVFCVLTATHVITYPMVLALAFVLGVLDTLNMNARMALMPTLVPRELIASTVALQALGVNTVQVLGPSLTGLLINFVGVPGCIGLNAATFALPLVGLFSLSRGAPSRGAAAFGNELREGVSFVRTQPKLWAPILLAYLHGLLGVSVLRLIALYARTRLGVTGRGYGLLVAATGLGAFAASFFVTARASRERLPRNIVAASVIFAVSLSALGLASTAVVAFFALVMLGFGQMSFRSAVTTTIQTETPDRLRGRVVSLVTLDFSLWSIGGLLIGWTLDSIAVVKGMQSALTITLVLMSIACLGCSFVFAPIILRAARREQPK